MRRWLSCFLLIAVVITTLSKWIPPGESPTSWGRGEPLISWQLDQKLGEQNDKQRRQLLYTKMGFPPKDYKTLLELVDVTRQQTPDDAVVQIRGARRNFFWLYSYHLYPRRVIGTLPENGGTAKDPIRDETDWLITYGRTVRARKVQ